MRRYLLVSLLLLSSFAAYADISFDQLARVSTAPDFLKGRFSQQKYLQALDASLLSSGEFEYSRGRFIRWNTLAPIQNELTMTPTTIVNKQANQASQTLDVKTNPTVAVLSDILFSVLTAEWGKLSTYFELKGKIVDDQWQASLQPTDASVAQFVDHVELQGDGFLRRIVFFEKGGDRTTIDFENLSQ
ncbi:MAG: hypothetical protein ACI9KN_001805 [Gammaproteobacteria bacterium]